MKNGTHARKFLRRIKVTFPTSLFPAFPLFPIRYKRRKGGERRRPYWPRKGGEGKVFSWLSDIPPLLPIFGKPGGGRKRERERELISVTHLRWHLFYISSSAALLLFPFLSCFSIQDVWRRRRRRMGKWYQERRREGEEHPLHTAL